MSGWISVADNPPDCQVRVYVWFGVWVVGQRLQIMHRAWSDGKFYDDDGRSYGIQPTRWMPLPDPPEES